MTHTRVSVAVQCIKVVPDSADDKVLAENEADREVGEDGRQHAMDRQMIDGWLTDLAAALSVLLLCVPR